MFRRFYWIFRDWSENSPIILSSRGSWRDLSKFQWSLKPKHLWIQCDKIWRWVMRWEEQHTRIIIEKKKTCQGDIHLLFILFCLLLFKYICLHFPATTSPAPCTPTPHSILPPLTLSTCPSYMFFDDPSPSFPHYHPPPFPLVTVNLFFISVSLVIYCLLVCFVD